MAQDRIAGVDLGDADVKLIERALRGSATREECRPLAVRLGFCRDPKPTDPRPGDRVWIRGIPAVPEVWRAGTVTSAAEFVFFASMDPPHEPGSEGRSCAVFDEGRGWNWYGSLDVRGADGLSVRERTTQWAVTFEREADEAAARAPAPGVAPELHALAIAGMRAKASDLRKELVQVATAPGGGS